MEEEGFANGLEYQKQNASTVLNVLWTFIQRYTDLSEKRNCSMCVKKYQMNKTIFYKYVIRIENNEEEKQRKRNKSNKADIILYSVAYS